MEDEPTVLYGDLYFLGDIFEVVLMLEEEEDLQAKPVSESLGKLWMRAATAKLYLVFYIYLRHYDL